jgi:hypothetical protein
MAELLSADNWQQAVQEAIEELPDDIRDSVGHSQPDARSMVVSIAGEPIEPEDGESWVSRVELKYWHTLRERGWPKEHDELYQPGGRFSEQVGWPVISIFGEATSTEEDLFPGRAPVSDLKKMVQVAILEELFQGGGMSLVSKDSKDRFVLDDGTPILKWQFKKRNRGE